jgi:hypothetical protein
MNKNVRRKHILKELPCGLFPIFVLLHQKARYHDNPKRSSIRERIDKDADRQQLRARHNQRGRESEDELQGAVGEA